MKVGDLLNLTITDDTAEGKGLARMDGMVCFVDGGVRGDVCEAQVMEVCKNYVVCRMTALSAPSAERIPVDCPVYDRCGGCTLRHVNAHHALMCKQNAVLQALRRVGLTEIPVENIIATTESAYRNKVLFHFSSPAEDGTRTLGYYAGKTHNVLPESIGCKLLPEHFHAIAACILRYGGENPAFFNEDLHALYLRSNCQGQTLVTVVTGGEMTLPEVFADCAHTVMQTFPGMIAGFLHADDPAGNSTGRGDIHRYARPQYTKIAGEGFLTDDFLGLQLHISPDGFFQVNHTGAAALAEAVLERAHNVLDFETKKNIVDLYCGSGFFALLLARAFPDASVTGVELNADAIRDAKRNAVKTGLTAIRFEQSDANSAFARYAGKPSLVIVDPPRAGLGERMCRTITNAAVPHVIYVSCSPVTLARDLKLFHEAGYTFGTVQPVDMFPRSAHVETVVLLSQQKPDDVIEVDLDLDELDITSAESKATYQEIKDYVLKEFGLKVSTLYISQIKRKCGIEVGEHYNFSQKENQRVPQCPKEKEDAIRAALEHFAMI